MTDSDTPRKDDLIEKFVELVENDPTVLDNGVREKIKTLIEEANEILNKG